MKGKLIFRIYRTEADKSRNVLHSTQVTLILGLYIGYVHSIERDGMNIRFRNFESFGLKIIYRRCINFGVYLYETEVREREFSVNYYGRGSGCGLSSRRTLK
jgi:hypothetical protein